MIGKLFRALGVIVAYALAPAVALVAVWFVVLVWARLTGN